MLLVFWLFFPSWPLAGINLCIPTIGVVGSCRRPLAPPRNSETTAESALAPVTKLGIDDQCTDHSVAIRRDSDDSPRAPHQYLCTSWL